MIKTATAYDEIELKTPAISRTVSDPYCGLEHIFISAKDHIHDAGKSENEEHCWLLELARYIFKVR